MSDRAELAAVLRRLTELLSPDDHNSNDWSGYAPPELRSEIQSFLDDVEAGRPTVLAATQNVRGSVGRVIRGERGVFRDSGCGVRARDDTVSASGRGRPSP